MAGTLLAERAAELEIAPRDSSWGPDDVILYHLGLGAGLAGVDGAELEYAYEGRLKVLPSFAVIPGSSPLADALMSPALDLDLSKMLHGEQELELEGPLPSEAAGATTSARVGGVYDKGSAALLVIETETRDASGRLLFVNRFRVFIRGAGGFGGDPGPPSAVSAPEREPDLQIECPTERRQALLYRLSGDKNPLHADPDFARSAGFDRPILHGLCTYGIACKAVVDELLGGDVSQVARYSARFGGVIVPGETLVVQAWQEQGHIALRAFAKERDAAVLTHAQIGIRQEVA